MMLQCGVHATVAGVLVAPEDLRDELRAGLERGKFEEVEAKVANLERVLEDAQSPLRRLEHSLHP